MLPNDEPRRRPGAHRLLPVVVWTLVVAVLLLVPAARLPQPDVWSWLDKPVHAVLFAVHFALLARALAGRGAAGRELPAAALGSGLYAVVCELAQIAISGRSYSNWDLVAGWLGIAVAAAFLGRDRATLGRDWRA